MLHENENLYDKLRKECYKRKYDCFAFSHVFEKRAGRLNRWVSVIKAFGILVPVAVGVTASGYGLHNKFMENVLWIAIPTGIFQFLLSTWTVITKWDDKLSYAYQAKISYDSLYKKFSDLAGFPPSTYESLRQSYNLVDQEYILRGQEDSHYNINEWEKRCGMRAHLREHQIPCVGCKKTPLSMESTDCSVCGNFSFKYKI